jgi:kinetochore protein NDC80
MSMGMQSVQRTSSGAVRKSHAPMGFGLSTPAHGFNSQGSMEMSTQRRSSVYSARPSGGAAGATSHQSFFATAPAPAGVPQDPRRLRDASVRAQMAQELMDYLTHNNFEMDTKHSLTSKAMTSPTQKDFNMMFQWLYHRLDPAYRFQKNIDQEVPPLLKQMRYPFEKSIMKSQIAAVGGNNWHTFLGLLHWMMQLARMTEAFAQGHYDDACAEAGFDIGADRIIFQFLTDAYREWLSVDDDDDDNADELIKPHIDAMAARFDEANKQHLEQVKMLEAESKALSEQIEELGRSADKSKKLDEDIRVLEDDRQKFVHYNEGIAGRIEKYQARVKLLEDEIAKVDKELEEVEGERQEMQQSVDAQGIMITDIDRMNADRERLQRGVEGASQRLEETRARVAEREAEATQRLEELEKAVGEFNTLAYNIGLIPSTATNAKGQNYELVLQVSDEPAFSSSQMANSQPSDVSDRLLADASSGYQPHHLLNLDLKGAVKNSIVTLRKEISERRNAALEQDINNHDLLDKVKEVIDEKKSEVEGLEHRVRAAEDEFEKTREITGREKMASDAQIEKMEKELAKMRASLSESVQLMEQREINTNIE